MSGFWRMLDATTLGPGRAYAQWGLKHKTYAGPLQPFERWIETKTATFATRLRPWLDAFDGQSSCAT